MHIIQQWNSSATIASLSILLSACMAGPDEGASPVMPAMKIKVLSNRADLISGGDAYVEVVLPANVQPDALTVEVNGRDASTAFERRADQRVTGVITGMRDGDNSVTARAGDSSATLTITNFPIGGPIFSGPQVQPWVCATPTAQPATTTTPATNGSGLPTAAIDAQCNAATNFKLYYRSTAENCAAMPRRGSSCFKPFDPSAPLPEDLAETTTDRGERVKYIVRVERGVINRGIYDIAVLFDPAAPWQPYAPQPAWNHKLLWSFGGSTGTPYKQYPPNSSWQIDYALARGFMVGVSAHTDQALNSNHVVASETLMMAKEHIVESYGEIRYTLGTGCSGGSIMQLQIASLYPGLLNGLQPSCTYPDSYSTSMEVTDCVLLGNFFKSDEFARLTANLSEKAISAKQAAIAGHLDEKACPAWVNSFGSANTPGVYVNARGSKGNNCHLLDSQVYDAKAKPGGVRCSIPDYAIAIWGAMPGSRIARRTSDNVGIEYGLAALRSGAITAEEFVVLNEKIGGSDVDTRPTNARMVADPEALKIAYAAGIISDARQLAKVPIIDLRGNDNSGIHMNWRAFAVRDRLDHANGQHDNQVIWRFGPNLLPPSQLVVEAFLTMDRWLANMEADQGEASQQQKVLDNKPAEAFDFCYIGEDYTKKVSDFAICDAEPALKYYASPRQVAGGPLSEDILKCQLKPRQRSDYSSEFTDGQWSRLSKVFPDGVCDWSKPGVGMQASVPWRSYADGPGGRAMGE